jgi:hypothetical protein
VEGFDGHAPSLTEIDGAIEAITAHGELIEYMPADGAQALPRRLLVPAPPRFVARQSGSIFILGIAPGDVSPFNGNFDQRVDYVGYSRLIIPSHGEELTFALSSFGLSAWKESDWLRTPSIGGSEKLLSLVNSELLNNPMPAGISNLQVATYDGRPDYYVGRWQNPRHDMNGEYVGRIPAIYGAAAWCVVRLVDGKVTHLIKLPHFGTGGRACDEAWLVLCAFDKSRGQPQAYSTSELSDRQVELRLFSPVSSWIQRRFHAVGKQNANPRGCLLSFLFSPEEILQEKQFLEENLWLVDRTRRRLA